MARPQEQLANALDALKQLQDEGKVAIQSKDLSRSNRERLLKAGFIRPIIKGWYVPSRPEDTGAGESTSWYASFWEFCATYLGTRLGQNWCLSPEQSVRLHAGNRSVPAQLLVRSPNASNNVTALIHDTSILEIRADVPDVDHIDLLDGLRICRLPYALVYSGPQIFTAYPHDARAALALLRDASEILRILLEGGHNVIAGRLVGALRNIGRDQIADDVLKSMRAAGYTVNEANPFEGDLTFTFPTRERSPYVNRIRAYWESLRNDVVRRFPEPHGIPNDKANYLAHVDGIYTTDAYHSLSIEGYRVSQELIERVRSGEWDPDHNDADREHRDAMAARGYWLAFQEVKESVSRVLNAENPGTVVDEDHRDWYRSLFAPSVDSGLLNPGDLAGYRNDQVYIRNSKHVPVKREAVLDCMPALFDHLREEPHPGVRTVLGHWVFVYIHPYMDGNGRMGRFLMNVMLASGGYPWTVIPVERRSEYMQCLESASVDADIRPFASFLGDLVIQASKHN